VGNCVLVIFEKICPQHDKGAIYGTGV